MAWVKLDISESTSYAEAQEACEQVEAQNTQKFMHNHLSWRLNSQGKGTFSVLTNQQEGAYTGFILLLKQLRPLLFQFGEITYFRKKLIRHELASEPTLAKNSFSRDEEYQILQQALSKIIEGFKPNEALSIEGLPLNSTFYNLIMNDIAVRKKVIALPVGKPFAHQLINMPPTLDEYLSQMSKKSRKSVQYDQRRLSRDFKDKVQTICYENENSIDDFLNAAIDISKTTYQWRLLGLGLRNRERLKKNLIFAAEQKWLRSYILWVAGKPAAFMLGYQYAGCYYYIDVGFNPDWSKWSVGSVLQMNVIEDLYTRQDTPAVFDFSTGFGNHKARFGNSERDEINMLLLPNTLANKLITTLYRINGTLSESIVSLLDRLGVKNVIKRLIRTHA